MRGDEGLKVMLVGGLGEGDRRSTYGLGLDVKVDQEMSVYRQPQSRGNISNKHEVNRSSTLAINVNGE